MSEQHYVKSHDLALAWALSLSMMADSPGGRISPFTVTVTDFADGRPDETARIRGGLDSLLERWDQGTCDTVANTIFPDPMWNRDAGAEGRGELYRRYLRLSPRLRRICPPNKYGIYFERLIDYRGEARRGTGGAGINQLDHIIGTFRRGNHRHSALVALVFDPERDHTNQRQRGFPCMHEVTFELHGTHDLGITGFYATQYYYNKAYGNLLGLGRLGYFVADALGRRLVRITCAASMAELGCAKQRARELLRGIGPLPSDVAQAAGGTRV